MELDEIVELADAVATHEGIASGVGTTSYSAQIVVEAATDQEAVAQAQEIFEAAAARAGLPAWPVAWAESIGEDNEYEDYE